MELTIRPPNVLFNTTRPEATQVAVWDGRFKAFKAPFEPETLREIKRIFPEAKVVVGQQHIDDLKCRLKRHAEARKGGVKTPRFQINLPPMEHQWEGADYLAMWDEGALFADCGVGKTLITLLDIVNKIKGALIPRSSVLVVSKLMTLQGWEADARKFVGLTSTILWEPSNVKIEKGETVHVADHGPKRNSLPSKIRTKADYLHLDGSPAILSGPRAFNPKKHLAIRREWRESGGVKYGKETFSYTTKTNVGANSIRGKIKSTDCDLHVINHEGLLRFQEELKQRRYDYIALDESTVIKNNQSKIFQAICDVSEKTRYKRVLTGTPMPQGPQDIWSQFYFLDRGLTFGTNYNKWVEEHFNFVDIGSRANGTYVGTKVVLRAPRAGVEGTAQYIERMLAGRTFKRRLRDCVDIPEVSIGILDVFLSAELERHYKQMEEELMIELDGETVDVTTEFAKLGKLRQITGGFIINREKEVMRLVTPNPKLQTLLSYIEEIDTDEKIVIFAIFRCEIELLLQTFGKQARSIYGGISDVEKMRAQSEFINDPSVRYLICQPQSAAHGINGLTVSRYLVFYSIDYRSDLDFQARRRLERTGQRRGVIIKYLLAKDTIDYRIYDAVQRKLDAQEQMTS